MSSSSSSSFSLLCAAYLAMAGKYRNTTRNFKVDEMDRKKDNCNKVNSSESGEDKGKS